MMLKKSPIEAYNTNHKHVFICAHIYLDSTVAADEKDLVIEVYNLVCTDHPSNLRKGGVYIYYKESGFKLGKKSSFAKISDRSEDKSLQ